MTWAQMRSLGVPRATITRWIQTGYLIGDDLPRVYAVAYRSVDERSRLFSLILFAGPSAELSHGTSAHWRGWLRYPARSTHISTPRHIRREPPGVRLHCRRDLDRELVDGVPCTTVIQTLLDLAHTDGSLRLVVRSLAQLDYARQLDLDAIRDACGRGRPGSANLLRALDSHMPQLARTRSELEDEFLHLCRRAMIPLPDVNVVLHGIEVDCHWPELNLVVELDGHGNHATASQRTRDQRRALELRAHGEHVIRYTGSQVFFEAARVCADLVAEIARLRQPHRRLKYPA